MQTDRSNDSCDWETFDATSYLNDNYLTSKPVDEVILSRLASFHRALGSGGTCIEIGCGPNLYPVLAGLPHRDAIVLSDVSHSNLSYLESQIWSSLDPMWESWQRQLQRIDGAYGAVTDVGKTLRKKCSLREMSVLDLPEAVFDCSSMHCVAESMTNDWAEFVEACKRSVRCLKPGGGFAVSLMLHSEGYSTGMAQFPAVPVSADAAVQCFASEASDLDYVVLDDERYHIREGHDGMIFISGTR